MTTSFVQASDGTAIAIEDAGTPEGPAIVLLHGIAQSKDSWRGVFDGLLAKDFRLVAYDLRGHGESGKPEAGESYGSGRRLGDDLDEVLAAKELTRPIIVAWSYGGVVLGEYLRHHGAKALGGILWVAPAVKMGKTARDLYGKTMADHGRALMSEDEQVYNSSTAAFVAGCAASPLDAGLVQRGADAMKRVPAHARRALLGRSEDFSAEVAAADVPMATVQGEADSVVLPAMSVAIAALRPDIVSTSIPGVGHLPWVEAPEEFEAAVRALSARVAKGELSK